jgi:DNA mismatch endonuclease (patch repair protein)
MSPDPFSPAKRRQIMQAVRQQGTDIEVIVRRAVVRLGHYARANAPSLPGRPDLSNQRQRWAIFVHGCFWHGHSNCPKTKGGKAGRIPATNRLFWQEKISGNRKRDVRKARMLRRSGYRVLTLWGCDVQNAPRLERLLVDFFATPIASQQTTKTTKQTAALRCSALSG